MDFTWDTVFLDNTLRQYTISLAIIGGIFILRRLLSRATAWLIARLVVKRKSSFDYHNFQELVLAPIELFLTVVAILIALGRLRYPEVLDITVYRTTLKTILDSLAKAVVIGCFMYLCNRLIIYVSNLLHQKAIDTDDKSDDQLVMFFRDFLKVMVWIMGILLLLKYSLGFDLGNVLTGLSIVGAAVALAFRESIENLIASFIIFSNKPFTVGDFVRVEQVSGAVEKIGLRSTRVRTVDKTYVTVPNKKMVDSILDNLTLRTLRSSMNKLELELNSAPQQIHAFVDSVEAYLQSFETINDHTVFVAETGLQATVVQVDYFVEMGVEIKDFNKMRQQVNLRLLELLQEHGLKLAAAQPRMTLVQQETKSE